MNQEFNSPQLPSMGLVSCLEEEDRMLLSGYGEFLPVQEGEFIIKEGDDQDALYFVISGTLDVFTETEILNTPIASIRAGESIGEMNLFDPWKASASVSAKSFSQVWRVTRSDFEAFINAYPQAGNRLLVALVAELSKRLRQANNKIIDMVNQKIIAVEAMSPYRNFWD